MDPTEEKSIAAEQGVFSDRLEDLTIVRCRGCQTTMHSHKERQTGDLFTIRAKQPSYCNKMGGGEAGGEVHPYTISRYLTVGTYGTLFLFKNLIIVNFLL
jgi:hypothetical protein